MKYFITGASGQLGYDLIRKLLVTGVKIVGSDRSQTSPWTNYSNYEHLTLDLTDREKVYNSLKKIRPDVVIHCAAWTAVDLAEEDENIPKVKDINVGATTYLAEICKKIDAKMIYISTDYVFDGIGEIPWRPDDKNYQPINVYGRTKLEGEKAVSSRLDKFYIVRIAWVFGINGNNFVKTMLKLAQNHKLLRVVSDQIGTPTYTYDLADLLISMSKSDKYGYYHATNEGGYISWYDFASAIFDLSGKDVDLIPVSTEEYGLSKAIRPKNSRLDKSKLKEKGFTLLPHWKDALSRYLEELKQI